MRPTPPISPTEAPLDQLPRLARAPMSLDERRAFALLKERMFGTKAADPVRLGRFVVRERLGSGGTGVVYRGFDPALRRDVAIKVVRREAEGVSGSSWSSRRLLREAELLARLDHPNVVRIFATGAQADERIVYVVMELVEGVTLQRWLEAQRRTWPEIVAHLRVAMDALAAAHRIGVLHRDFKPANVLLGRDGRLRVVDFGGVGTPGFMAPEQIRGDPVDARADVYAMCTVAQQALQGLDVPRWLTRAVKAGLRPDPEERPPSMTALARSFERPRHNRVLLLAASVVAVLLALGARHAEPDEDCPVPAALDDLPTVAASVQRQLDAHIADWSRAVARVCTTTQQPTEQTVICLQTTRAKIRGTLNALSRVPDADTAALVVESLPSPMRCLDASDTTSSPLRLRYELLWAEITASTKFGAWPEAGPGLTERLEALRRAALMAGDRFVEGRSAMALGLVAMWELRHDDARRLFEDAFAMSLRAGDRAAAFEAAQYMVQLHEYIGGDAQAGQRWLERAREVADDVGTPIGAARLLLLEAAVAKHRGNWAQALDHYDQAAEHIDEQTSVITRLELLNGRGMSQLYAGRPEDALRDFEAALQLLSDVVGSDTMELAPTLNGLGIALRTLGRFEEAEVHLRRLIEIVQRQQPGSPDVAAARGNLAQLYADEGRYEDALEQFRLVRKVFEDYAGPQHPAATKTSVAIASALRQLGRHEEARREARYALRWNVAPPERQGAWLIVAATSEGPQRTEAIEAVLHDPTSTDEQRTEAQALR